MKRHEETRKLVESAIMIAIATVLSIVKLVDMPYGGSVTLASSIPVMLISYRHGMRWGFGSALVYAALQQILGLENFAYLPVPTWYAILALIVLDYMLAFLAIGVGGAFRGKFSKAAKGRDVSAGYELALGAGAVSLLRYICHTVAGATVWAGLPLPDGAALIYSLGYNATYMIPEAIINVLVAMYLGSVIDFTARLPRPYGKSALTSAKNSNDSTGIICRRLKLFGLLALVVAAITDACLVAKFIQDPDSGDFTLAYLSQVSWTAFIIVTSAAVVIFAAMMSSAFIIKKRAVAALPGDDTTVGFGSDIDALSPDKDISDK